MVRPYIPSPEDVALLEKPYRLFRGRKIDIRWSGGWLTPEGKYYAADYANGITHESLAARYCAKEPLAYGSGSIMSIPTVIKVFRMFGWMRITYLDGSSFCVEATGMLNDRREVLLRFAKDFKEFNDYYLNDRHYATYLKFVAAVRNDAIKPSAEPSAVAKTVNSLATRILGEKVLEPKGPPIRPISHPKRIFILRPSETYGPFELSAILTYLQKGNVVADDWAFVEGDTSPTPSELRKLLEAAFGVCIDQREYPSAG